MRTSRTDAMGRTTSYTLDNWGRVTAIDYPTGTDPTFTFDAESNLTGWTDSNGTWARTYDNAGRILTESLGGSTRATWAYDALGKKGLLSTLTDANSRTMTYSYTARDQLYQVSETAGTATYQYDNAGNETGLTNQNSTTVTRVFDDAGRLTSVTNKTGGGATLSSFAYQYNSCNERTSCTEASGDMVSYGYSAAHRLTSESRTGSNSYSQSWSLNGVGNRTSQTVNGTNTTFSYSNDDELNSTSGGIVNSYSYNANGEQTGRTLAGTSYTLAWDYDGQLTSITQGSSITSFVYDALGRRFSRTAGGTTTNFLSAANAVLLEKQGSTTTAVYTHGNALLRKDGEYPLYDGLGSARSETNSSQTVTATLTPDAFGNTVATTGSTASRYGYAATSAYRSDGDAGLMHVGARYYDPQVGRFTSRDTVLSEHPYLYCEHDPANAVDPSGHGLTSLDGNPESLELTAECLKDIGGATEGGGEAICRIAGTAEANAVQDSGGFVAGSKGHLWGATRVFFPDRIPSMVSWGVQQGYSKLIIAVVAPGWRGAVIGPDGWGLAVDVRIVNSFIRAIMIKDLQR